MSGKTFYFFTVLFALAPFYGNYAYSEFAKGEPSVKQLADDYKKTTDNKTRRDALKRFQSMKIRTQEDVTQLRTIFADKKWDEGLFASGSGLVEKIDKPEMAGQLILMLEDEKEFIRKLNQNDLSGKTEREGKYRFTNVEFIISKLGNLKSKEAVPVLKEYLALKNMQYAASEALGKIGDKSMSNDIREKAYKGEDVNYGGMGIDEARKVVQDLEDKGKKDKWAKIAKQIVLIKNPEAKPHLKKLFNHEQDYVREQSAGVFFNLATKEDLNEIKAMATNSHSEIRYGAIQIMKKIKDKSFDDSLISLLTDSEYSVRRAAAKAVGYNKIDKAIPGLEKTLSDSKFEVRKEVFIALYILTGKKYDFFGRNSAVDQQAEIQKQRPSFH